MSPCWEGSWLVLAGGEPVPFVGPWASTGGGLANSQENRMKIPAPPLVGAARDLPWISQTHHTVFS